MDLHRLLGVELPVIQAPMAGAHVGALAIAVCEAGGRLDFSPISCGQNASGCKERPAGELTRELAGV